MSDWNRVIRECERLLGRNIAPTEDFDMFDVYEVLESCVLKAESAAVMAELKCAQNDIELRDKEIAALKAELEELNRNHHMRYTDTELMNKARAEAVREAVKYAVNESGFQHGGELAVDVVYLNYFTCQLEQGK